MKYLLFYLLVIVIFIAHVTTNTKAKIRNMNKIKKASVWGNKLLRSKIESKNIKNTIKLSKKSKVNNYIEKEDEVKILAKKIHNPIILLPIPSIDSENWDYSQNGKNWHGKCLDGAQQSPIDLPAPDDAKLSAVKPIFQFREITPIENLKIVNENSTLKIKHKNFGKVITVDGKQYNAIEINFHTPAEHKINGKTYDMEMQIIFTENENMITDIIAKQIILSFLFQKTPGVYNKFFDDMEVFNLPRPSNERRIENTIFIPKIFYNLESDELPYLKPFSFYTYQGSSTTPPCEENTIHYVAANPIPLGSVIIESISESIKTSDSDSNKDKTKIITNNRLVQNLNGRSVYLFNSSN
jgi:carbonic anhydrase